ncbi:MAG: amino acid adenylation domain-containing protein [Acidobacteriaceae bacterium]|jgi:amino acid adenylation domain-containing protein
MCFLQWFERYASASPNALALTSEGRKLTYRELNLTSDKIANGLREAGVRDGCLVGVLLDRSPEMVAGLLGIWKAGGAYVPLDPAAPIERIALMLEDAAPPFVLTRRKLLDRMPSARSVDLCVLDVDDLCARKNPSCQAGSAVSANSLAYVIYTSGSTGKPKGARITHGGLANTISGVGQDLRLGTADVVLAWSTIAFDVACLEIYLPLAFGAALYLVETELVNAGGSRIEQLHRSAATVVFGTPTMYRLLLEEGWPGDARMQVVVGGEALPLSLAKTLARACRSVWNQYGPTETAICATRAKIDVDVEKITIGHSLPNVTVRLLNEHLQPVARGSIGEVFIGGAGVALGYLRRPDLSHAHFLPDPFAGSAPARMYRSGDLAVELTDGSFDFLGRVDDQVKIRGFRVELGEIESALRQCDGVQAAVARAIEFDAGDRRLVAFVIGDGALQSQWKRALQRQLPHYMIPSEFVALRSFPTTQSGKVDVQALDALRLRAAAFLSPSATKHLDPVEARLKEIWERLLKINTVGLDEDFFALGGHSLLAARMLVQVEKWCGSKLPHSVLVEHPTIHGLASCLRESPAGKWPALVTIQTGAHLPPLFVAHGIGGSLLSFINLAAELGPEQPVYGLQLPAFIDVHQAEVRILAANFVKQVRALQPSGPYNLAGHSSGGLIVFEMACQLMEQGETVGLLALLDCDPNKGKLRRQPRRSWGSLKASFRRLRAEVKAPEFGVKDLFERRVTHLRVQTRAWLAARARRAERKSGRPRRSEGYLVLAVRDYELKSYPGSATLFMAQDEPRSNAEAASPWADRILGGCEIRLIPGTHRTIMTRPQVASLAREMRQRLVRNVEAAPASVVA